MNQNLPTIQRVIKLKRPARIVPTNNEKQYHNNLASFYNNPLTASRHSFDLQPLASQSLPVFNGRNQQEQSKFAPPLVSTDNALSMQEYSNAGPNFPVHSNNNTNKTTKCSKMIIFILVIIALFTMTAMGISIYLLIRETTTITTTTSSPCTTRIYSQYFVTGVNSTSQCVAWQSFVASLTCTSYSQLQMNGSDDTIGITLSDTTMVNNIAVALRTSTIYNSTFNGNIWNVGSCVSSGIGLTTTGNPCACPAMYSIRPCIGVNTLWGGINSTTCPSGSQTMMLIFQ